MKKVVFSGFLFFSVLGFVFSYDGTLWGGYDGNYTRYTFIQDASNTNYAQNVLRESLGYNISIQKFFNIGEDDVDSEDVQMVNDHRAFLQRNFRLSNGDCFSYLVKRGNLSGGGWDGWLVFSHYSSSQGWYQYLYYFSVR